MNLNEALKLARLVATSHAAQLEALDNEHACNALAFIARLRSEERLDLARAVLAMAPVVEAARAVFVAKCMECVTYGAHFTSDPCAHTTADDALRAALSTLSSKVPHGE